MKHCLVKLRSPVKWHGGKSYLARRFIALFPPHRLYVEPFLGGGSILLNKSPAEEEIAGDMNPGLIRMWRMLRDLGPTVRSRLAETPYSELSWQEARGTVGCKAEVDHAWAFIVANRMSRGGLGKDFAWSERLRGKGRPGGPVPGEINSWETFVNDDLPRVTERIRKVGFQHKDAHELIHEAGRLDDALVYCDPPYLHETRTHTKAYDHEMSRDEHEMLLVALLDAKAKVFLSGYRSSLYDDALADWTRHEFSMPNHSAQGKTKQRRIECLWESPRST